MQASPEILRVVLLVPIFLFSLCFHEFAHAWMAVRRGDKTPADAGRLTMHPMAHADILGTFILPIICIYYGAPFFGWARPVPIDARNFKYGRKDVALVAAAGPLANILLSLISTGILWLLVRGPADFEIMGHKVMETVTLFTVVSIQVNLMLAFFNLIPIPPLDGFNVIQAMLSGKAAAKLYDLSRYATLLLFVLLFTGSFRVLSIPVMACFKFLLGLATVT
jgi:Zn-dependent protease